MMAIIKYSITTCFTQLIFLTTWVYGQEKIFPEIGKSMPDFALKIDENSRIRRVESEELKGKHYILDFWNTGCSACVASFPKMDSLRKVFSDKLEIILIGLEERHRDARRFYEVYRVKFNLKLPCVFDSSTFQRFVPVGVPHLIWVDNAGIVKAITTSKDVNEENIRQFLNNQIFKFEDASYAAYNHAKLNYNAFKPFLINGNGGADTDYVFRSILAIWNPKMGSASLPDPYPKIINGRAVYQIMSATLEVLYSMAYFGTLSVKRVSPNTYPTPKLNNEAISTIEKRFPLDQRFAYSVEIPLEVASRENVMKKMRDDLNSFFGLEANVVSEKMACHNLVIVDSVKFAKNIAIPGKRYSIWLAEDSVHHFVNTSIKDLIEILPSKLIPYRYLNIFDLTNCTSKLTFDLEAKVYDLESIRAGLRKVGLDLKPTSREMDVLMITKGH